MTPMTAISSPVRTALCMRAFTLAIMLATVVGCSGSDPAPPSSASVACTGAANCIGSAGGTVTGPDGVQVVIPQGALNQPTTIGIARTSTGYPTPLPEGYLPSNVIYEFTPHDLMFNKPVRIRMPVPTGTVGVDALMASRGGDWQVNGTTITTTGTGDFVEWERNSFSFGFYATACSISPGVSNPYPCSHPRGNGTATSSPNPNAIIGTAVLVPSTGGAASWDVQAATTVRLTLSYQIVPDCITAPGPQVRLLRWNPVDPLNTPNRVTTLLNDVPATLALQTIQLLGGAFGGAGSYERLVGSTTFDVTFSESDYVGIHAFGFSISCTRGTFGRQSGGEILSFRIASPLAPIVTPTIGGTVSGLTGTGLVLQNNGGNDLPVAANGPFTFTTAIAAGGSYSVTVLTQPTGQTCTVPNGSGNNVQANVTNVAVNCVAGSAKAWQGAALLENNDMGDAFESQVAIDASGNAMAVWSQPEVSGGKFQVWARRYVPSGGWGTAVKIQTTDNTLNYRTPQIAFDVSGNAIVVFAGFHPDGAETWAARYTAGSNWGTAARIASSGLNPQIAMDASGNAMAVWQQWNGGANDIGARRYVASSSTWEAAQVIEPNAGSADAPQLAMDGSGNVMVVWSQWDGAANSIYANRYSAGAWGTAVLVELDASDAASPHIASDSVGNMMAVWQQTDSLTNRSSIYSNRYSAGTWGTAALVETSPNNSFQSAIAMNGNGSAMVVWQDDNNDDTSIWARRYVAGVAGPEVRVDDLSLSLTGEFPRIAINGNGDAMAVFKQANRLRANRYVAGTGWSGATAIDSSSAGAVSAPGPEIAVDGNGNAIAVWSRSGTTSPFFPDVWANVFR